MITWGVSTVQAIFALFSGSVCVMVIAYALWRRARVPNNYPLKEDVSADRVESVKIRLDLSAKLFDVGVVLLGVLWGLILSDKVPVKLSQWADVLLFVSSNALLVLSLFFHLLYKRRVATLMWDLAPSQPDISSQHVNYLFDVQWLSFFASITAGLLTVLSTKVLGG
jgi:hypothetical protein